jgi:branched-chain amino acid transport system ATP-binding protein
MHDWPGGSNSCTSGDHPASSASPDRYAQLARSGRSFEETGNVTALNGADGIPAELLPMILELFPVLAERRNQLAGTLSGGEQQMLAIGRGLASAPELLMLDEPSMGLAPAVVDAIFERIRAIHRAHGLTILLVEQRVVEAIEACDYGYVLETGRVALHGPYDTLLSDARVKRAYLGI